jgi:hypothetical protein
VLITEFTPTPGGAPASGTLAAPADGRGMVGWRLGALDSREVQGKPRPLLSGGMLCCEVCTCTKYMPIKDGVG